MDEQASLSIRSLVDFDRHHLSFQISHEACRSIGVLLKQHVARRSGEHATAGGER